MTTTTWAHGSRPKHCPPSIRRKYPGVTYPGPGYLQVRRGKASASFRYSEHGIDGVPARQRPTFHEIRSLGARTYRAAGYPEAYIQALMTHADKKTTSIYLEGGQLTDAHYHQVEAGLILEALR